MASEPIDIPINVDTAQAANRIRKLTNQFKKLGQVGEKIGKTFKSAGRTIVDGINRSGQEIVKFNGNMLSLLFFGMELKRVFGDALKSIFEGYKKLIPESHAFNRLTTRLSANWEFFKFQLADALAKSPVFQKFIQYAINLLQAFQKLPTPIKELIGWLLIIGTIIGSILFFVGVWTLGMGSLLNVIVAMKTGTLIAAAATWVWNFAVMALNKSILLMSSAWAAPIAMVVLIAVLWKELVDKFGQDMGFMTDSWKDYVVIFVGAFINGVAQIILSLVQLATLFIDFFVNIGRAAVKFGEGLADVISAALDPRTTVKDAFANMFDELKDQFLNPNNYIMTAGLQKLKDSLGAQTLEITQGLVNASNVTPATAQAQTVNNTIVIDGVETGLELTAEQKSALQTLLGGQNIDFGGTGL